MKSSKKKAKEDAKKKAAEAKQKEEAEKRKKAQQLAEQQTHKSTVQTIDLSELYKDMPNDNLLQTGYESHSANYYKVEDEQNSEWD